MENHDPLRIIGDLRDHLSQHDKPLAFLFGAGTSCSVNIAPAPAPGEVRGYTPLIPAVLKLTELCKNAVVLLGTKFQDAWAAIERECGGVPGYVANVEEVLSRVRLKRDAIGTLDKLIGLNRDELTQLESTIRKAIVLAVTPAENIIPAELPHSEFALWIKKATRTQPTEVFTTNYDILIERSLEMCNLPIFDGFVGSHQPFFLADAVERDELLPSPAWVRLWKIHGSINWHLEDKKPMKIRRGVAGSEGHLILPSHLKYDESRKQPYLTLLSRLSRVLEKEDALLVTCGYSFSDQHINATILSVLENRPRTHVIALQFEELSEASDVVKLAKRFSNFMVICRNGAVVGGRWALWGTTQTLIQPLPENITSALDIQTPPGGAPSFAMRLGDFGRFCKFLAVMATYGKPNES